MTAPEPTWAVWRVHDDSGRAREVRQCPRTEAESAALSLNLGAKPGETYMALPLGGTPSDG